MAFSLISAFHIVIGELAPKSWAIQQAERVSLAVAYPLHWFYWLFRLPISALNGLAAGLLRRSGSRPRQEHELAHSQEELRMIVTPPAKAGRSRTARWTSSSTSSSSRTSPPGRDGPAGGRHLHGRRWTAERALEIARSHTYTRYPSARAIRTTSSAW